MKKQPFGSYTLNNQLNAIFVNILLKFKRKTGRERRHNRTTKVGNYSSIFEINIKNHF